MNAVSWVMLQNVQLCIKLSNHTFLLRFPSDLAKVSSKKLTKRDRKIILYF